MPLISINADRHRHLLSGYRLKEDQGQIDAAHRYV